jgi:hypothetical protein
MWLHRRWHSSIVVQSFRRAGHDIDHYLVVTKVRERFAVCKQETQKFDVERFNFRKIGEIEVRKRYKIKVSNRFAALDNLNDCEDIKRAWENIKENIKTSAEES